MCDENQQRKEQYYNTTDLYCVTRNNLIGCFFVVFSLMKNSFANIQEYSYWHTGNFCQKTKKHRCNSPAGEGVK